MTDLLETVIEAHGGLPRWAEFHTVSARLVQGGVLWSLKGQPGALDDVFVEAGLHDERFRTIRSALVTDEAHSPPSASPSRPTAEPSKR